MGYLEAFSFDSWAKCLNDRPSQPADDMDPWGKFSGYPGISYTAKDQCEILLRDKDAVEFINGQQSSVCENLHCRSPNRSGFFFAGPALQGTECGNRKWCEGGSCVSKKILTTTTIKAPTLPTWGSWITLTCKSECLQFGKGFQMKRRRCSNNDDSCDGVSQSVSLCDDKKVCQSRRSVSDYGTQKCKEFSRKVGTIDAEGVGLQASHESLRVWMSCAIFCKRKNTNSYFTPRVELNELGVNPYYPDGTLCHQEGNEKFYCIHHHCLPEVKFYLSYSFVI